MAETLRAEEATDEAIGLVLLAGLLLSIGVMVLGLLVAALERKSSASKVLPLDSVLPHLTRGDPAAILDLGILLLFATPLVGVLAALFEFVRYRNAAFAVITLVLLVILVAGFAVGLNAG